VLEIPRIPRSKIPRTSVLEIPRIPRSKIPQTRVLEILRIPAPWPRAGLLPLQFFDFIF
jgi:hypothetical protein